MNERRRLLTEYIRDDADEELDYLTIIPYGEDPLYVNKVAIYQPYMVTMTDGTEYRGDIWYSVDGGEWILYGGEFIDVPCFSKVRFKGNWHEIMKDIEYDMSNVSNIYTPYFYSQSSYDWWLLEGTPLSLIHGDNFKERKNDWNYMWDIFMGLFANNYAISQVNNPKTFLPSTELSAGCYYAMFAGSGIMNAPELPAETLKEYCYYSMFEECSRLEEAPALNAKALMPYCYQGMFYNCYNLCYAKMTATDNFYETTVDGMFGYCAEYGLVMLSQELIDVGFAEYFFSNWTVISEDYTTNEQGYPESKGSIHDYTTACFNVPFIERVHDEYSDIYYNDFMLEANKLGKELYDIITSWAVKWEINYMGGIFVNRHPILEVMWCEEDREDGTVDEWLQLKFRNAYGNYYGILDPDGTFWIYNHDYLLRDYIK